MTTLATDAGRTDIPLLDETIGANLARTVVDHGDVEAVVARHQGIRWTYAEFAERVARVPGVGAEFICTSISSLAPALPEGLADSIGDLFPNMVGAEFAHRGYVRHTVSADEWIAEYRIVEDVTNPASPVSTWRTFGVAADAPDVVTER
jgi:phosphodiesterase/alkaline phosphatase D-like protein